MAFNLEITLTASSIRDLEPAAINLPTLVGVLPDHFIHLTEETYWVNDPMTALTAFF